MSDRKLLGLEVLVWTLLPVVVSYYLEISSVFVIYSVFAVVALLQSLILHRLRPGWRALGVRTDNLAAGWKPWLLFSLIMTACVFGLRLTVDGPLFSGFIGSRLQLYTVVPVYVTIGGAIQEFFYRGYMLWRLKQYMPSRYAVAIVVLVFGLLHLPFWVQRGALSMFVLSALGGVVWTLLYDRYPNVILASLSHNIVGLFALLLLQRFNF
jgi:membrane protease YdiL (CAAX protease family)